MGIDVIYDGMYKLSKYQIEFLEKIYKKDISQITGK